jgi:hypothetical protein
VAIAFLSSLRALRTVNCLAWPSDCWRLYLLRLSNHSLWVELLVMHLSLRLNNACCMLSRLDGEYAVDFFAKPLVLYSELLMHTWSQEDNRTWTHEAGCSPIVISWYCAKKTNLIRCAWAHVQEALQSCWVSWLQAVTVYSLFCVATTNWTNTKFFTGYLYYTMKLSQTWHHSQGHAVAYNVWKYISEEE